MLAAKHRTQLLYEATAPAFPARATRLLAGLFDDADWPPHRQPPPARDSVRPRRTPEDRPNTGTLPSTKLGRDVHYESTAELQFVRLLEASELVAWFCEQPLVVPYHYDGIARRYYPDFLVATADGRCVLIEVKNPVELAFARNQAKADAAKAYAHQHGWGYLATSSHRSMRSIQALPVDPAATQQIAQLVHAGTATWHRLKPIRERHRITGLHLTALALKHGWETHLWPYRLTVREHHQG